MSAPRWSSLEGWLPDPQRRGFLRSDEADDSWRRSSDGRWWSTSDIDAAQVVVDEIGQVLELKFETKQRRLDAARATLARLPLTPGDRAANERPAPPAPWKAVVDSAVEAFKSGRSA